MNGKQVTINKKTYSHCDDAKQIASNLLNKNKLLESLNIDIPKIEYLIVYPNISKFIAGKCIKAGRELKFFSGNDYLIEVSGDLWDSLTDDVKELLILHELMHVHVSYNKKGEVKYTIRDHNVKDFYSIIKEHGVDWLNKIKLSIFSIYDIDSNKDETVKI